MFFDGSFLYVLAPIFHVLMSNVADCLCVLVLFDVVSFLGFVLGGPFEEGGDTVLTVIKVTVKVVIVISLNKVASNLIGAFRSAVRTKNTSFSVSKGRAKSSTCKAGAVSTG